MFCSASWSFEHYLPLDRREKLIIDQVIPSLHAIRLAWSGGSSPWTVWYRVKDSEEAWRPLTATEPHAVLSDLAAYIEYELSLIHISEPTRQKRRGQKSDRLCPHR